MRFILFAVLALSVVGCRSIMDPTFMPASYAYHTNVYKSPPGPPADDIGYPYSKDKNAHILNEWQAALDDLVEKAEQETDLKPGAIYVADDMHENAFNNAYSFALREALRKKGYTLVATPSGAETHLAYSAKTENDRSFTKLNKNTTYRDYDLKLKITSGAVPQEAEKTYNLPSYGYRAMDSAHDVEGVGEIERTRSRPLSGENP